MACEYLLSVATAEDAAEMAPRLSAADRTEVLRLNGHQPLEALQHALAASLEAYTARADDDIICMFGLAAVDFTQGIGSPWLLGTDTIQREYRLFLRESKRVTDEWKQTFPVLLNYIDNDHTASLRWMQWMGFELSDPIMLNGHLFRKAEWRREHV